MARCYSYEKHIPQVPTCLEKAIFHAEKGAVHGHNNSQFILSMHINRSNHEEAMRLLALAAYQGPRIKAMSMIDAVSHEGISTGWKEVKFQETARVTGSMHS